MAFNSLYFKIKDHFEDKYFSKLFDLSVRVVQYKQFRKENGGDRPCWSRNKEWNKRKEKNLCFIKEGSAQDESNTSSKSEDSADEADVYVAEMVKNR